MAEDKSDYVQLKDDQIDVLTDLYNPCPICFKNLTFCTMPGEYETHWQCKKCGTIWKVGDLIAAYNINEVEDEV